MNSIKITFLELSLPFNVALVQLGQRLAPTRHTKLVCPSASGDYKEHDRHGP